MSDEEAEVAATAAEDYTYLTEQEQEYLAEVGEAVASHEVRLERLEEKAKEPTVPRDWITRHKGLPAWTELADWVDWLNANYSMPDARRVRDCWPSHPGMVHVLAGLRSAWRAAVLADEAGKEQGNAMAAFHDYHLFPFFQRLEDTKLYRCSNGHRADDVHLRTDRSRFPEDLEEPSEDETDEEAPEAEPLAAADDAGSLEDDAEWWKDES